MDFREAYDAYQESIPAIAEVEAAETQAREVYEAVKAKDRELADRLDTIMGKLARAYEKQGFNGGLLYGGKL